MTVNNTNTKVLEQTLMRFMMIKTQLKPSTAHVGSRRGFLVDVLPYSKFYSMQIQIVVHYLLSEFVLIIIDLFGANSHLVQSRLKLDVTLIITYTGYTPWWEKSYRHQITVTQIRADLRCQQFKAAL